MLGWLSFHTLVARLHSRRYPDRYVSISVSRLFEFIKNRVFGFEAWVLVLSTIRIKELTCTGWVTSKEPQSSRMVLWAVISIFLIFLRTMVNISKLVPLSF
jgi:hypothetical protein